MTDWQIQKAFNDAVLSRLSSIEKRLSDCVTHETTKTIIAELHDIKERLSKIEKFGADGLMAYAGTLENHQVALERMEKQLSDLEAWKHTHQTPFITTATTPPEASNLTELSKPFWKGDGWKPTKTFHRTDGKPCYVSDEPCTCTPEAEKAKDFLVELGTHNPDGTLTEKYGGEAEKPTNHDFGPNDAGMKCEGCGHDKWKSTNVLNYVCCKVCGHNQYIRFGQPTGESLELEHQVIGLICKGHSPWTETAKKIINLIRRSDSGMVKIPRKVAEEWLLPEKTSYIYKADQKLADEIKKALGK